MKKLFIIFVIGILITAIVVVKNQKEPDQQQIIQLPEEKQYISELKIGICNLDTMDPILSNNKNIQDVCKLIYEPLITVDEQYKIKGVLANEWAKTGDTSYIVKLKEGIRWHNGAEFTSQDVIFTINKIKRDDVSSIYKQNVKNISKVEAIDKNTIKIDLIQKEPFFEYNLIFPIECANDYNGTVIETPSGTGLYKINKVSNSKIDLTRNQYKENIENVGIKLIQIKNYATTGELYNDFKIGNLDVINTDSLNYTEYIGTLGYKTKSFYGRNYNFLAINTKKEGLENIEVRKAISYAIDKNEIISTVYNNKYFVADNPLDYGTWLYTDENSSIGFNPEQSKSILTENGWVYSDSVWQKNIDNKIETLEFNLVVNANDELRIKTAEIIKQQLEKVGISITIYKVSNINDYINNKDYDIGLFELKLGLAPDLSVLFGQNNLANYQNEEMIRMINEIIELKDDKILKEKYLKIIEISKTDLPYISLFFSNSTLIYNQKLIGAITPTWYNLYNNIENWKLEN